MQKIISLFQRNYDGDRLVRDEIVPGAEWVPAGEGVATVKYDGTCCLVRAGQFYKRYEVGRGKTAPPTFEAASPVDPTTGKQQGWVPVGDGPEDQWHREAWQSWPTEYHDPPSDRGTLVPPDGTYELVGPKVQGNPYGLTTHRLWRHGSTAPGAERWAPPRTYAELRDWFARQSYGPYEPGEVYWPTEGIVWHHPDGRMVKIKRRDFGLPWPIKQGD